MKVNGFNVEHDLQAAISVLDRMFLKELKVQFAMAAALTKTGQDVKARQKIHGNMRTAILKEHEDAAQYAASKR